MIALAFPTLYEAEDVLKKVQRPEKFSPEGVSCTKGFIGETEIVVAILGIGPKHSVKNARVVLQRFQDIGLFILAGFAGALIPELQRGQILVAQGYSSDELIGIAKGLEGFDIAQLCTTENLAATVEEKKRLAQASGCQFVDMETAAVAAVTQEHGVEILAIRAISDLLEQNLPADVLSRAYNYPLARPSPVRLAFFLLFHPHRISPFRQFLAPLPSVRRKLTLFLVEFLKDLA